VRFRQYARRLRRFDARPVRLGSPATWSPRRNHLRDRFYLCGPPDDELPIRNLVVRDEAGGALAEGSAVITPAGS